MKRKRWTAVTEVNESVLQFREKRKWQIALRRYVLERNKSSYYAPFFAIGIEKFRNWIEVQFDEQTNWDNFSEIWQFDHIVPIAYFDFSREEDMQLCWNFTNIRVEKTSDNKNRSNRIDVLAAKAYFETLYRQTGYDICSKMVDKITRLELQQLASTENLEHFIRANKEYLDHVGSFASADYDQLNTGRDIQDIVFEKNFLKKFGT